MTTTFPRTNTHCSKSASTLTVEFDMPYSIPNPFFSRIAHTVLLHLVGAVTEEIPNTIYQGIRTVRYVTSNEISTHNKKPTHSPYDKRHVTYGQKQKLHNQPGVTTVTTKVTPVFTTQ
jgi:hypothetical protein